MMEDMERYGDYNDYEVDAPKSKNKIVILIKILIGLVCFSVVGVLVFRMIFFNYYPSTMKTVYFTDELKEYYLENDGNIKVETQSLRYPYDDADVASFICSNLFVVKDAEELQVTVRYNNSALEAMIESSNHETLSANDPELFTFRLYDNYGNVYENLTAEIYDTKLMYHYYKLAFSGVEFTDYGDGTYPEWIRLEIFIKGQKDSSKPYAMVPVYENNADYNIFKDYVLTKEETAWSKK